MKKLRQVLAQEDTVLFIGSGISLWSGLPSWTKLIEELACYVDGLGGNASLIRDEARRGDLLQAASYGFDNLTKQQIGDFIRSVCHYGVAKPHEIHKKIVSLGPRCFVTTNYDNLIEESLRIWRPERFFRPPVTNRHLTETAEIVHARAIDFIFKPHGDAGDSDSIVLTREQYRQLLPGGERQAALESVKMLLASRPVVYLGFGLRDPDFLYIRDLLANTYKGGARDHFAVMADVVVSEAEYWRRNYGIHLVSYETTATPDGLRDHGALLTLLDELLASPSMGTSLESTKDGTACSAELVLALARHAARLTRFPKNEPEFPVRVHLERGRANSSRFFSRLDRFDLCHVQRFLDEGPERSLLIGLPGAGKTYSLRRAAARLAEKLNEACLADNFDANAVVVPIFVDLKLYRGNLQDLVERSLPADLSFPILSNSLRVRFFLDSFNEMPREQWESGGYEADFAHFLSSLDNASVIIGSRTSDGLAKLGFPSYHLDQIDESYVLAELERRQIWIGGRFVRDILSMLQKPFYFQLCMSGEVTLPAEPHPREIFHGFFLTLGNAFQEKFGINFNLLRVLSLVAYEAINSGEEAQPLSYVLQVLRKQLQEAQAVGVDAAGVANWLVSKSILIPYTGSRIAFFHQSVTEFLAASEFGRRYQVTPQILHEKLSLTRWDQALFLSLSFLPEESATSFMQSVMDADLALALNASKYVEFGRDELVGRLLAEILRIRRLHHSFDWETEDALEYSVPISDVHEPQLRAIIDGGDMLAASAVARLIE